MGVRGSGHTERIRLLGTGRHTGFPRGEPWRYLTPETPLGRGPPLTLADAFGAYKDRLWNCHAQRSSGLHVDHQLEPGRLLDGKIGGLGAVQELVHVHRRMTKHVGEARAVRHHAPRVDELESDADRSASANRSAMRTVIADLSLSFTPEG